MISLVILPITGSEFNINANKDDSIQELKIEIFKIQKISTHKQMLMMNGEEIISGTLEENKINDGATIRLLSRIRSGLIEVAPHYYLVSCIQKAKEYSTKENQLAVSVKNPNTLFKKKMGFEQKVYILQQDKFYITQIFKSTEATIVTETNQNPKKWEFHDLTNVLNLIEGKKERSNFLAKNEISKKDLHCSLDSFLSNPKSMRCSKIKNFQQTFLDGIRKTKSEENFLNFHKMDETISKKVLCGSTQRKMKLIRQKFKEKRFGKTKLLNVEL